MEKQKFLYVTDGMNILNAKWNRYFREQAASEIFAYLPVDRCKKVHYNTVYNSEKWETKYSSREG